MIESKLVTAGNTVKNAHSQNCVGCPNASVQREIVSVVPLARKKEAVRAE